MAATNVASELLDQAERLFRQVELVAIYFDRIYAEVHDREAFDLPDGSNISTRISVLLGHRVTETGLTFQHEARVTICPGEAEQGAAVVEATIVVEFASEESLNEDPDVLSAFGEIYSHRIMFPYLREVVQSALARVGIVGATMALLQNAGLENFHPPR